mmetsp:Transcript_30111/g.74198  ORF Transcript_30111/g.74198 Transcript_30111/m.74198 type:complete len:179 (-) Transcript_30111:1255-1791(-)
MREGQVIFAVNEIAVADAESATMMVAESAPTVSFRIDEHPLGYIFDGNENSISQRANKVVVGHSLLDELSQPSEHTKRLFRLFKDDISFQPRLNTDNGDDNGSGPGTRWWLKKLEGALETIGNHMETTKQELADVTSVESSVRDRNIRPSEARPLVRFVSSNGEALTRSASNLFKAQG